jgi:hypothetical protein
MNKLLSLISLIFIMIFLSVPSYADPVNLDLNNVGIPGGPWGTVTLTQINDYKVGFSVDPFANVFASTNKFGIQTFAFNENTSDGTKLRMMPLAGWSLSYSENSLGGYGLYGKFDVEVKTSGSNNRKDPLYFEVYVLDNAFPISTSNFTTELSDGDPGYLFAAHIAGFSVSGMSVTSGKFSTSPPSPVPEPATMLLLGSGLIGLAGYARRRFKK